MQSHLAASQVLAAALALGGTAAAQAPRLEVRFDATEAERALAILDAEAGSTKPGGETWRSLLAAEGYRRLHEREAAMGRAFTDEEFRAFLAGAEPVAHREELRATLAAWQRIDLEGAAARAFAYLPSGATIRATIYPMIKPRTNSFVWDLDADPAIFLYLDPGVSADELANTVAHELHHIGYGTACPGAAVEAEIEKLDPNLQRVLRWQGAFGEGIAMLAAAGGPDIHPHAASPEADRARWDRDMARTREDTAELDAFFLALLDGQLGEQAEIERARSYYGVQGPWYTVGWSIAATIERELGRDELIRAACDPRLLLPAHRRALARRGETAWSDRLLAALVGAEKQAPSAP